MLLGKYARRSHIGNGCLQFVLPAADNVALTLHHRIEAGLGNLRRIVLLCLPNLSIKHISAFEERRRSRARHQARDRHARVLHFIAQRKREGVEERLGAAVDRLEHVPGMKRATEPVMRMRPCPRARMSRPTSWMR